MRSCFFIRAICPCLADRATLVDTLYLKRMDTLDVSIDNIESSAPVEGGGCDQEEDQVHSHEQRDREVKVEAVRGGLDEALAAIKQGL